MLDILVSTEWLEENIGNPKLVLLDASMGKVVGKSPIEYDALQYIPNSRLLDLENSLSDLNSSTVNAFPTEEQFNMQVKKLGINADSIIVLYDNQGIYSSPRARWIFKSIGFDTVFVLDGGLPKWIAEGRKVESNSPSEAPMHGNFIGSVNSKNICDSEFVLSVIDDDSMIVFDARSKERFLGLSPEPREGMRSGHIPNSICLPFGSVLLDGCFKPAADLSKIFEGFKAHQSSCLVFSCGSGITACIILMAARLVGYKNTVLYDGSWSEWGAIHTLPIEEG